MISVEYSDDESEYVDTSGAVDPFDFINCDSDEGAQDVEEEEEAAPAIALTPKGTPSYADAVRSRPTSECVPNEPEPEDPVVEDIDVETVEEPVQATPAFQAEAAPEGDSKSSRAERKVKKALQKLGLQQVEGINRVVLRKDKSLLFVVPSPEVFRKGDSWVVLGEARVEDTKQRAREMAAQKMAESAQQAQAAKAAAPQTIAEEEEAEDVDISGIEEKDIELVVAQAGCSRAKAVAALRKNDNDIVNSIMELTI